MKRTALSLFIVLYISALYSQPCNKPLPPADSCQAAPLVCDLDGFCSDNSTATVSPTPDAFCGQVENDSWLAFIAGSKEFSLNIKVSDCVLDNGMQAQIFKTEDCKHFISVSNCIDPVKDIALLKAENLVIGNKYYLMIDGKQSDVCHYEFEMVSGEILSPAHADIIIEDGLCDDNSAMLKAVAVTPNSGLKYKWSTQDGKIISNDTLETINVETAGRYSLVIIDDLGCKDSVYIDLIRGEKLDLKAKTPDCFNGEPVPLEVELDNFELYDINWSTQDGHIVSGQNTKKVIVDTVGKYEVIVYNPKTGCRDSLNIPLAEGGGESEILAPNAFFPSGREEINKTFKLYLDNVSDQTKVEILSLKIYDRWGELVFESKGNESWDGTKNGKELPPEVYLYKATLKSPCGTTKTKIGQIMLLR